jgi:hypothetical protein
MGLTKAGTSQMAGLPLLAPSEQTYHAQTSQVTESERTPFSRMLASVIGIICDYFATKTMRSPSACTIFGDGRSLPWRILVTLARSTPALFPKADGLPARITSERSNSITSLTSSSRLSRCGLRMALIFRLTARCRPLI